MNIDWKNHIISFFSAVIGIAIAFRLEDYREDQEELERVQIAYDLVIKEIENNISIYEENVILMKSWLEYYDVINDLSSSISNSKIIPVKSYLTITMDSARIYRLKNYIVNLLNDSLVQIQLNPKLNPKLQIDFSVDILPKKGIATSAWTSSVNSGIFTRLSPQRLSKLTEIFDWISNDLGQNEYAFYEGYFLASRDQTNEIAKNYLVLKNVQEFKLQFIRPLYNEILEYDQSTNN